MAAVHNLDTTVPIRCHSWRWACLLLSELSYSSHTSTKNDNICQSHVAVAVIQSIPIFDETKLFSIPLPKAVGTSISFSYFLHIYLVLMFLGECLHKTFLGQMLSFDVSIFFVWYAFGRCPASGLFINFRHLYKQRKRRFCTKKRKANWDSATLLEHLCCLLISSFEMILISHTPVKSFLIFKLFCFTTICLLSQII